MNHIVVVGAGVSGLATAYHIRQLARDRGTELRVTVLEAGCRVGGRVWTERAGGFQIEAGASGFLDSKRSTLDLCTELGLDSELTASRPEAKTRYLLWHGRLQKLPTGPRELLRSGLLSWRGKLRLVLEAFVPRRSNDDDISVYDFACRRIGREATEVLVGAAVSGIHAGDSRLLSAPAAFPRMVEIERNYGSLIRAMPRLRRQRLAEAAARAIAMAPEPAESPAPASPSGPAEASPQGNASERIRGTGPGGVLWSLRGGMGQLVERLAEKCVAEIIRGVNVRAITPCEKCGWLVQAEGDDRWQADAVVLACPGFAQAAILESIDAELSRLVAAIPYNSLAVVALGFRRADLSQPLDGFGYLSPHHTRRDVLGVLWNSSIFENRAPDGMVLLQAMCGGWNRPEVANWDDDRLVNAVRGEVRQTLGITGVPALVHITRWPQAIPQYHIGHLARVDAIEARRRQYGHIYLTGNSYRGISVNDCTEEAVRCAQEVVQDLARSGHQ